MLAVALAAVVAAIALAAALAAMLFWQSKRAASAMQSYVTHVKENAATQLLLAASRVALTDKERALNMVIAERDRLEFTVDTVEDQRDALLKEALNNATPGSIAINLRDALNGLRVLDSEEASDPEALPNVPSA